VKNNNARSNRKKQTSVIGKAFIVGTVVSMFLTSTVFPAFWSAPKYEFDLSNFEPATFPIASPGRSEIVSVPRPTPPDQPLEDDSQRALTEFLITDTVENVLDDFMDLNEVNAKKESIANAYRGTGVHLTGREIADNMLAAVRSVVSDQDVLTRMKSEFDEVLAAGAEDDPAVPVTAENVTQFIIKKGTAASGLGDLSLANSAGDLMVTKYYESPVGGTPFWRIRDISGRTVLGNCQGEGRTGPIQLSCRFNGAQGTMLQGAMTLDLARNAATVQYSMPNDVNPKTGSLGQITKTYNSGALRPRQQVTATTQPTPRPAETPEPVKGMNVTAVDYGNNGSVAGSFRNVGNKSWNSVNSANQITVTCNETGRDEWSVYLTCADQSRIMLNLWKKEVIRTPANGASSLIGKVIRASSAAVTDTGTTAGNSTPTNTTPSPTPTGTTSSSAALKQYIKSLNYNPKILLAVQGDGGEILREQVKSTSAPKREVGNGEIIRCIETKKSLTNNFKDIAILQPTEGVIYPGALIFADKTLVDGLPRQLTELKRAPITVRVDLPGLEEQGSITIAQPNNGSYQTGLNRALSFWNNGPAYREGYVSPQRLSYNAVSAYSSEQLGLELGVNVRWASGDAAAQFAYSSSKEKNVVVAMFKQVFYTVTFDAPNSPEQFFDSSVTVNEAQSVFNSQTPPAYVSTVNYGRLIMFRLETDKSVTAVDARAALNYGTGQPTGFDVNLKAKYDQIIANSKVTAVAMGGNAEAAAEVVSARQAKDLEPIIKGRNAVYSKSNPGVPIAYTVKFVKDNAVAKLGSTTDFTETNCEKLPNIFVKLVHAGAYIAHFKVTYDVPNSTGTGVVAAAPMEFKGRTAGWQQTVEFPGDATNIRLQITNDTGLVWQPQREIINRVLRPADYNKCFKVVGTTLGSSFNNDCSIN